MMSKGKKENKLWSKVKYSLESHYDYICSNPHSNRKKLSKQGFINIGLGGVIPDVIGIKDVGSRFEPEVEIIAVEVKEKLPNYRSRHMDQARRASLFAHKVFLAAPREFTPEEVELAVKEKVGLFELQLDHKRGKLKLIVPSPVFEPSESKVVEIMRRLEFYKCSICRCYWNKNLVNSSGYGSMHVFSKWEKPKFVSFICERCSDKMYQLHSKELRNRFAEEWKFKRLNKKLSRLGSFRGDCANKNDIARVNNRVLKVREKIRNIRIEARRTIDRKMKGINKKVKKVIKRLRSI
jgi:hypothetical protein